MKNSILGLALVVLAMSPWPAHAQELTPETRAKAMSTFELASELNIIRFGKIGLACTASTLPIVALAIVDTVPVASTVSYIACDATADRRLGCNGINRRAEGRELMAQVLGGAGSVVVDLIGGAADLVIAPFDYLAHGKLEFDYKAFPTVREAYRPTLHLARNMYSESSICSSTKRQAEVLVNELKGRLRSRDALPTNPQVVDNSIGQPKSIVTITPPTTEPGGQKDVEAASSTTVIN